MNRPEKGVSDLPRKSRAANSTTGEPQIQTSNRRLACSGRSYSEVVGELVFSPGIGATVDLQTCEFSKDRGAATLATTWEDTDFSANESAFYYVRVLENPVCRWSMYDAKRAVVEHPADLPATIKERVWSSPIWHGGS
ncbi:DUF3604 domain-containing protein [Alteromonas aestuariivivens]|uniref:DUF3604 domain-containing protein n=1 Tax=Alteromonas aestuariivivens TaxID=1938339 RepID=A0A3D8M4J5_9ALTE|nr:DUF3604 domain-containing protein [Alteromonas aestuariivivens]RDV24561.1 DUF3604 domain-containing protein [Alteromonas aestuariivivens]